MLADHIEITGARENNLKDVSYASRSGRSPCSPASRARASRRWSSTRSRPRRSASSTRRSPRSPATSCRSTGSPTSTRSSNLSARDHRRPEAARRQLAVDGRHDHRHQPADPAAVLARRQAVRRLLERVLVQRPAGHVPRVRGARQGHRARPRRVHRQVEVAQRGRGHPSGLRGGRLVPGNSYVLLRLGSTPTSRSPSIRTDEWQQLLYGTGKVPVEWQGGKINATYEGLVDKFTRLYIKKDLGAMAERNREVFLRYVTVAGLPALQGRAAVAGGARGARSTAITSPSCSRWRPARSSRCCRGMSAPVPPRRSWRA